MCKHSYVLSQVKFHYALLFVLHFLFIRDADEILELIMYERPLNPNSNDILVFHRKGKVGNLPTLTILIIQNGD